MGNAAASLNEAVAESSGRKQHVASRYAAEAEYNWSEIDTTKVDVGRLAPRILAAQKPIALHEARPVHVIHNSHECYVRVFAWDLFRDLLVSGGGDGCIRLWRTKDYCCSGELKSSHSVRALLVLATELASGHSNGHVLIWDMEAEERPLTQKLSAHREAVYALAMLSSGDLVTGAEDIRIFRRESRSSGFELVKTVSEEVLCMCSIPRSPCIITGDMNSLVTIWDSGAEWKRAAVCRGHQRSVWAVCFIRECRKCASGSADCTVRIWCTETWRCERVLADHSGWVVGLACGPRWLFSCSVDQTVRVWDCQTWTCERTFSEQKYEVYTVCAFSGGLFATGGADLAIIVYGGSEHKPTSQTHLRAASSLAGGVQFAPLGAQSAAAERESSVIVEETVGQGNSLSAWAAWLMDPRVNSSPELLNELPKFGSGAESPQPQQQQPQQERKQQLQLQQQQPQTSHEFQSRSHGASPAGTPALPSTADGAAPSTPKQRRAQLMAISQVEMTMTDWRHQIDRHLAPTRQRQSDQDMSMSFDTVKAEPRSRASEVHQDAPKQQQLLEDSAALSDLSFETVTAAPHVPNPQQAALPSEGGEEEELILFDALRDDPEARATSAAALLAASPVFGRSYDELKWVETGRDALQPRAKTQPESSPCPQQDEEDELLNFETVRGVPSFTGTLPHQAGRRSEEVGVTDWSAALVLGR